MKVAYFSNQFADKQGHGLARYSRKLFSALQNVGRDIKVIPVAAWSSMDELDLAKLKRESGLQLMPLGQRITPLAWTFLNCPTIEYLLPDSADVVHAVSLGYPIATKKPFVVTVHDLGPLTHPEFFTNTSPWVMKQSLKQMIKQADAIICVSNSTADELTTYVGDDLGGRIEVIHEGVSPDFFLPTDSACLQGIVDLPLPGTPFVLATGKISPRKNVQGLVKAMMKLGDSIPHHLVLVGGDGWGMDELYQQLGNSKLKERIHFPGYVSDEQLRALYALASAYVHPSLYEGFGLTVLEAMAAGCPVITSNTSSLPEVVGEAAILIDPHNSDEMAEAIKSICMNSSLEEEYISRGHNRAKLFTWEQCARLTTDVYRRIR